MRIQKDLILEKKGSFEKKRSCYIREHGVAGVTIKRKMYETDEKERYFHLYYSLSRENRERMELEEKLKKMSEALKKQEGREYQFSKSYEDYYHLFYQEEKEKVKVLSEEGEQEEQEKEIIKQVIFLFGCEREDVVEAETDLQGYFSIVTSERMTAAEAIGLYNNRDVSEKLFRADKSFLGNHSYRVCSNEAVSAKMFIEFVALIIRNRFYTALQDEMKVLGTKPNYMTVPAALRELEKIEMVRLTDNIYHLDHAVTKTQKTILRAFGMDEIYVEYRAGQLQAELKRIAENAMKKGA